MAANGMLAGLVAITAPCAFVDSTGAVIIGAIAGILVAISVPLIEKFGVDDPVGAVSVHGVCGVWGVLSVGLFADGQFGQNWNGVGAASYLGHAGQGVTGLFYGDASQLAAQAIDAAVVIVWSFLSAYVFFTVQKKVMGIRSKEEDEVRGLDIPEMGAQAYPETLHVTDLETIGAA
jgi:Amt family ammonium transporter